MKTSALPLLGFFAALLSGAICAPVDELLLPGRESESDVGDGAAPIARIAHVTDTHLVDEESPARFTEAYFVTHSAWRPYESYSTQLFDGIIRAVNRIHDSGRPIDFLMHTGDACDNAQSNELGCHLALMDGDVVAPLTGPDDRDAEDVPPALLDQHAEFQARGLYEKGRHGEADDIPWYYTFGNHDRYAIGLLAIFETLDGGRRTPLPAPARPGVLLPRFLDPLSSWAHGRVTPADPGPPQLFELPLYVEPNPERAYVSKSEFVEALGDTRGGPPGHGFADSPEGKFWYSTSPVPGVRLIGLDTTDQTNLRPNTLYDNGAVTRAQLSFLQTELDTAVENGELVVAASHHPSASLTHMAGSEILGEEFRALLNEYSNVVLHVAGHTHRNKVIDRGGYLEIETCSTLDWPQEGRLIEIWRDGAGEIFIAYEMFSHIDDELPPLGADPLRELRERAQALARTDKTAAARQKPVDPTGESPGGESIDRRGIFRIPNRR